ncbi:MAG: hypothetical protein H6747_09650 [Deltaproteobacteria bacterium]|nr:hypothetical protein [Deltaproteobacteria bacterium]
MSASNSIVSIKSGSTAADRRVIAAAVATTTPPSTSADGTPCPQARWVHVVGAVSGAAALACSYFVMGYVTASDTWVVLEAVGTAGTRSLNTTTAPSGMDTVEAAYAYDRLAVVVDSIDVGASLDVWLAVSGT